MDTNNEQLMTTHRASSRQITVLRALLNTPMTLDGALKYNQITFNALLQRGLITFLPSQELFSITLEGREAVQGYLHGNIKDMRVKTLTEQRANRVRGRLGDSQKKARRVVERKPVAPQVQPASQIAAAG